MNYIAQRVIPTLAVKAFPWILALGLLISAYGAFAGDLCWSTTSNQTTFVDCSSSDDQENWGYIYENRDGSRSGFIGDTYVVVKPDKDRGSNNEDQ